MKKIVCERVLHDRENRITLRFPYDTGLIKITKSISGAKWSKSMYSWHIPDNEEVIKSLNRLYGVRAILDFSAIKPDVVVYMRIPESGKISGNSLRTVIASGRGTAKLSDKGRADIERFRKWLDVNRYPESTIRTYTGMITTFLKFVSPKEAEECTSEDLVRIVDEYILPEGLSHSFQNQMVSAVKKFYGKIYRSVIDPVDISRPRPQHRLPNVLSKEEVQ